MAALSRSVALCLFASLSLVWSAPPYNLPSENRGAKIPIDLNPSFASLPREPDSVPNMGSNVMRRPVFDSISLPKGDKEALDSIEKCLPFLWYPNGTRMQVDMTQYYQASGCTLDVNLHSIFDMEKNNMIRAMVQSKAEDLSICHSLVELLSVVDAFHLTPKLCESRVLTTVPYQSFCASQSYLKAAPLSMDLGDAYPHLRAVDDLLVKMGAEKDLCRTVCGSGVIDAVLCQSFVDVGTFFAQELDQLKKKDGDNFQPVQMMDPEDPKPELIPPPVAFLRPPQPSGTLTQPAASSPETNGKTPPITAEQNRQLQSQQQQTAVAGSTQKQEPLITQGRIGEEVAKLPLPGDDNRQQSVPLTNTGEMAKEGEEGAGRGGQEGDKNPALDALAELLRAQGLKEEEVTLVMSNPQLMDEFLKLSSSQQGAPQAPPNLPPQSNVQPNQGAAFAPPNLPPQSNVQTSQGAAFAPPNLPPQSNVQTSQGAALAPNTGAIDMHNQQEQETDAGEDDHSPDSPDGENLKAEDSDFGEDSKEDEDEDFNAEDISMEAGKPADAGGSNEGRESLPVDPLLAEAEEEVIEELEEEDSLGILKPGEEKVLQELEEKDLEGQLGDHEVMNELLDKAGGGVINEGEREVLNEIERVQEEILEQSELDDEMDGPDKAKGAADDSGGIVLDAPSESSSHHSWHIFTIFLLILAVIVTTYLCSHNRKRLREGVSGYFSDSRRKGNRRRTRDYKPLSMTEKM